MLQDGERLIKPADVLPQVRVNELEGIVVLGLGKQGKESVLQMSSLTINELCFLSAQLQAHIAYLLGPMKEG